jgi:hypothetical protein
MTTVTNIMDRLAAGELDTEQAAAALAEIAWPPVPQRTLADIERDPDPEPESAGGWADVEAAFIDGRITHEQYTALVAAVEQGPTRITG